MIFILCPNDFWHKRKIYYFDPYNVFLAIATNLPQRLETWALVVQGHICCFKSEQLVITIFIVLERLGLLEMIPAAVVVSNEVQLLRYCT